MLRISESANQRISESANQRISESANQRIPFTHSLLLHGFIRHSPFSHSLSAISHLAIRLRRLKHGLTHSRTLAIRHHHGLSFLLCAPHAGAGRPGRYHGDDVRPHRRRGLEAHDEVLGQAVPDQLRHGRCHRHRAGVPVRHELVGLLALCGRYFRRAAGHRGAAGLLHRINLPGGLDLRLGEAVQAGAPGGHLARGHRLQPVGLVDPDRQLVHAGAGGLYAAQRPGRNDRFRRVGGQPARVGAMAARLLLRAGDGRILCPRHQRLPPAAGALQTGRGAGQRDGRQARRHAARSPISATRNPISCSSAVRSNWPRWPRSSAR